MKKIVLVTLAFCLSQITYSQTNTFPATGDVGIGTTTPDSKLHLYNNIDGLLRFKIQNPSNGINAFTQISLMNDISGANLDVFSSNYKTAGWKNKAGFIMGGLLNGFIISTPKTIQFDNVSAITKVLFDMETGNVGIGTTTPTYLLEVNGRIKVTSISVLSSIDDLTNNAPWHGLGATSNNRVQLSGYYGLLLKSSSANIELFQNGNISLTGGNVGIGTTTPEAKLDINGNIQINGGANNFYGFGQSSSSKPIDVRNSSYYPFVFNWHTGLTFSAHSYYGGIRFYNQGYPDMYGAAVMVMSITNNNVGIGTTNPQNKLDVAGTIRCTEVKVVALPWPDFVFHPTYKLRTLGEVEQFIKTNNHLPEIPTESEVKENGVGLGEMNAKLLQKVEELTLYLIEQQKMIIELNKRNESQDNEIKLLKEKNINNTEK